MSLIPKLKLQPEQVAYILNAPEETMDLFALPDVKRRLPARKVAQVVVFTHDRLELEAQFSAILPHLTEETLFWIAYPKKSGSISSDLTRDEGWQLVYDSEWMPVSSASINDDWSGIRLRHRSQVKSPARAVPPEERQVEGIDFVKRTARLPQDAIAMMKPYRGLETFFDSLSFTHKKEYVESIVTAKKPETRLRRIEKMIEMVMKLREHKELKRKAK